MGGPQRRAGAKTILIIGGDAGELARAIRATGANGDDVPAEMLCTSQLSEARAVLTTRAPAGILLDPRLPDAASLETAINTLRTTAPECPLIALMPETGEVSEGAALQAGAHETLPRTEVSAHTLARVLARAQARDRARTPESLHAAAFSGGQAVMITDSQGIIEDVNDAFTRVTGYDRREVIGERPQILSSGYHAADFYDRMWAALQQDGYWEGEIWNRRKTGDVFAEWQVIRAITDSEGDVRHYVAVFHDMSDRKRWEEELWHQATYDPLMAIPNRAHLEVLLDKECARASRYGKPLVAALLDIDLFKTVNDQYGHAAGDAVLKELATIITGRLRGADSVGRWGGEEILVLLPETDLGGGVELAEVLRQRIAQANFSGPGHITVSIGVAAFRGDETPTTLVARSDAALYDAKAAGRNQVASRA